ncbi:jg10604 [Pararge aegeria aegeria]|uniref:Jg10604 protein n=1 Tax=Pararge aegeria aegeria TaxID=348720 RepID=A0A8S4RYW9_9NEOP|nr:jg10604 [Pararge aegeria aegeria]
MESAVHAPLRVGKKMRKRRELDALVGGGGARGGRLLSASSDEGEPWGRRTSRRRRSRPFVRLAAALALCVCVVSAATVLWLFVDVRRQIVSLRIEMDRVSTSSAGVGDELQVCHTQAKELRTNASELSARLNKLELDFQQLSKQMTQAAKELSSVSEQLSAAPKLADMPRRLAELQRTVADFGSQISGFDSSLTSTRKQAATATSGVEELKTLLSQLQGKTNETIANLTVTSQKEDEMKQQITALNTTLVSRLDGLQARLDDMNKPLSIVAPVSSLTLAPSVASPAPVPPSAPVAGVNASIPGKFYNH